MIENLLTIKDLHVDFDTPYGVVHAVRGVDLTLAWRFAQGDNHKPNLL